MSRPGIRTRTHSVIGALALIGLLSLALRVCVKADYTIADALLDLGYEGLPAAILFLLIDSAIHQYEQRQNARLNALQVLRGETTNTTTELLSALAEGDVIRVGALQGTVLDNLRLSGKTICDGHLDRADMDSLELSSCTLRNLSMNRSLIRLSVLENCTITDVNFDGADLTGSLFVQCMFDSQSSFRGTTLTDVRFNECSFPPEVIATMSPAGAQFLSCHGLSATVEEELRVRGALVESRRQSQT